MPILAKTCRLLFRGDANSDTYPYNNIQYNKNELEAHLLFFR